MRRGRASTSSIDKPAGESLPQFRRILDAATKKKLLVQMGYMYRYNPGVVLLRDFLKKGWLGEVFEVHAVMSKVVGPAERDSDLRLIAAASCSNWAATSSTWSSASWASRHEVTPSPARLRRPTTQLLDNMLAVFDLPAGAWPR